MEDTNEITEDSKEIYEDNREIVEDFDKTTGRHHGTSCATWLEHEHEM